MDILDALKKIAETPPTPGTLMVTIDRPPGGEWPEGNHVTLEVRVDGKLLKILCKRGEFSGHLGRVHWDNRKPLTVVVSVEDIPKQPKRTA